MSFLILCNDFNKSLWESNANKSITSFRVQTLKFSLNYTTVFFTASNVSSCTPVLKLDLSRDSLDFRISMNNDKVFAFMVRRLQGSQRFVIVFIKFPSLFFIFILFPFRSLPAEFRIRSLHRCRGIRHTKASGFILVVSR